MSAAAEGAAGRRYRDEMDHLVLLAQAVSALDLDWLLGTIERADTLGPVVYPTAWRASDLESQRRLVTAAVGFRDALAGAVTP